jgi:transcriptional regulator with XRE-family HTH domain
MPKVTEIENESASQALADRVKRLRKRKGQTLESLASSCGVSRSMLSQIERAQANPTLAVACRIAQAFSISVGELVDEPWTRSAIELIHGDDPTHLYQSNDECCVRTLSPLNMEKDIEFYEITLSAGASLQSAAHFEGTRELFTLSKGGVEIVAGDDLSRLTKGDSAHYRADIRHSISNNGRVIAKGYLVVTYNNSRA